ncbi:MAG: hypothetical protein L6V93_21410 [Clostridiales bacterium]|nr:MAG: hypothetical protein L6V93_21410 [Clostridiales bacterium]
MQKNRGYVSAYLEGYEKMRKISTAKSFLRPKDEQTEKDFSQSLRFLTRKSQKHGYDVTNGKISDVSAMGSEKTISLTNGNDVVTKENDLIFIHRRQARTGVQCIVLCKRRYLLCF